MHLCASCRRHVKASPCPFCGEHRSLPTLEAPAGRLSRAQLVAGAALVVTVAACGGGNSAQPDPGVPAAVYGAPAAPDQVDAGADPQSNPPQGSTPPTPQPPTAPVAMYGAPPS